ncbi:MAG: SPOR domain-containing protein [Bacteroidales bacterium]|nr:SPOR domain-containing protein [Bacteroidales bacterium]
MEKHILSLLNTNLRVIIPDFGAFIIRQKEPLIVVFNEFLRYNDGLLIDYIAKREDIDKEIAKHQVTEYAETLVKTLESGKEIKIEGIGTLRKTDDEKIEFIQAGKETPKKPSKKTPEKKTKITSPETSVPIELMPDDSKKAVKSASQVKSGSAKNDDNKQKRPESKPKTIKGIEAETEKPGPESAAEKPAVSEVAEKPVIPAKAEAIPKPVDKPAEQPTVVKPPVFKPPVSQVQKKKSNKQHIIWIVLIIIVVALINVWFIFNNQIKGIFSGQKFSGPVADTLGQMVEMDTNTETIAAAFEKDLEDDAYTIAETAEEMPVVSATESSVSHEKRYYIVAGCFSEEINADALVKALQQKGYDARKYRKMGNLHYVSYISFPERNKALKELERIRKEEDPDAWMNEY